MTLTSTDNIPGFGRVWLPKAPRRISSTRYELTLQARFDPSGDRATVIAACDEHRSVLGVALSGKDQYWSFTITVDTSRVRNASHFAYKVAEDLFRSISRKVQPASISPTTPGTKPPTLMRQPAGVGVRQRR